MVLVLFILLIFLLASSHLGRLQGPRVPRAREAAGGEPAREVERGESASVAGVEARGVRGLAVRGERLAAGEHLPAGLTAVQLGRGPRGATNLGKYLILLGIDI